MEGTRVARLRAMGMAAAPSTALAAVVADVALRHRFSGRETQLLLLAASGYSRHELADALGIEEPTVKTLIRRILRKYDGAVTLADIVCRVHRRVFADPGIQLELVKEAG